jgi:hypothetical protein
MGRRLAQFWQRIRMYRNVETDVEGSTARIVKDPSRTPAFEQLPTVSQQMPASELLSLLTMESAC